MVNVTVWLLVNEEMVKVWLSVPEAASPAGPAGLRPGPVGPWTNQQRIVLYER